MIAPQEHEHYEHYNSAMIERLDGAWGHVDTMINRRIAALVPPGARVLDIGCGFGTLTDALGSERRAVGLDALLVCLRAAHRRHPGLPLACGLATDLPLRAGAVDCVLLKDVLHHLVDETPVEEVFEELERVGVDCVVVVDPNPNALLLAARRLLRHRDPVCPPGTAVALFEEHGFRVEPLRYEVLVTLPLSGGYVGPVLLPRWRLLWEPLLAVESWICRLLDRLRLARFVCWRYVLVARRVR